MNDGMGRPSARHRPSATDGEMRRLTRLDSSTRLDSTRLDSLFRFRHDEAKFLTQNRNRSATCSRVLACFKLSTFIPSISSFFEDSTCTSTPVRLYDISSHQLHQTTFLHDACRRETAPRTSNSASPQIQHIIMRLLCHGVIFSLFFGGKELFQSRKRW